MQLWGLAMQGPAQNMKLLVRPPTLERYFVCDAILIKPLNIVQTERHCGSSMVGREGGWKS
jgi:hypothetical protein